MNPVKPVTVSEQEQEEARIEIDAVVRHRLEQFRDLGFNLPQRKALIRAGADWHEAEKLLNAGCPLDIAFDILS